MNLVLDLSFEFALCPGAKHSSFVFVVRCYERVFRGSSLVGVGRSSSESGQFLLCPLQTTIDSLKKESSVGLEEKNEKKNCKNSQCNSRGQRVGITTS